MSLSLLPVAMDAHPLIQSLQEHTGRRQETGRVRIQASVSLKWPDPIGPCGQSLGHTEVNILSPGSLDKLLLAKGASQPGLAMCGCSNHTHY